MGKKKETIQDIIDRMNEDLESLRDKVDELESAAEEKENLDDED